MKYLLEWLIELLLLTFRSADAGALLLAGVNIFRKSQLLISHLLPSDHRARFVWSDKPAKRTE